MGMGISQLKGVVLLDGTKPEFDITKISDVKNILYFVKTSEDEGYPYINGKKYSLTRIDAGEYEGEPIW